MAISGTPEWLLYLGIFPILKVVLERYEKQGGTVVSNSVQYLCTCLIVVPNSDNHHPDRWGALTLDVPVQHSLQIVHMLT